MAQAIILTDLIDEGPNNRYIGPYVIASHLEQNGFDTVVIDHFVSHPDFFDYLENFIDEKTLAVLLSSTFLAYVPPKKTNRRQKMHRSDHRYHRAMLWIHDMTVLRDWFAKLREILDRKCPQAKIILGGGKIKRLYEDNVSTDFLGYAYHNVDYGLLGMADITAPSLLRDIATNGRHSSSNPNMITTKKASMYFVMPRENYEECPKIEYKEKWAIKKNEGMPIEVARGCLYNCKFCHHDKKASYRKPLLDLKDEFLKNYEVFGITNYHFCDDCFNDTKPKVLETCNTILSLPFKINWVSYARVDLAVKFPETLDIMMEAGARGLSWGIESFNYEAAKAAGKAVPREKVKQMLLDTRKKYKEQCIYQGTFIAGLPYETEKSQLETLEFLVHNDVLDFASFGPLGVTEYHEELDKKTTDYSDYGRNPEKHGFIELRFRPLYWRHATMDKPKADELAKGCTHRWLDAQHDTYLRSVWPIPSLLGYGFTWEQVLDMCRNEKNADMWYKKIEARIRTEKLEYWDRLLESNKTK